MISRRNVLLLGGLGAAGVLVGGTGLLAGLLSDVAATGGQRLVNQKSFRSAGGRLRVELAAAEGPVRIAGRQATALTYNGGLPSPTLFVRAGDLLQVTVNNRLNAATNLHVHGLHVSPQGNGDNALLAIEPGTSFDYEYRLPEDHPPGVYWYHPHHHGNTADQVFGGLYGAIIVEDPTPIPASRERVLVISDISLDASRHVSHASPMDAMMGREGAMVLVNGQRNPSASATASQRERWRIVNACASRYLKLRLDGQHLQLLGMDSGRFPTPREIDEVTLLPGNRADLLVTAAAGTSVLRTLPINRGSARGMMGQGLAGSQGADLLTLHVTKNDGATITPSPVPKQPASRDLRAEPVTARRELTFSMGMGMGAGMMSATIDGRRFDPARVDTVVQSGAIEEWTLTNTSPMDHPIHLHVWPMQLIDQLGGHEDSPVWRDVVNVPAFRSVRVRIPFEDFTGKAVYHCHILDHEDNGMMGIIEVR